MVVGKRPKEADDEQQSGTVQPFERKIERIGACKKWKTGDKLDLDYCRDIAKSIFKHEQNCELSADGNQSGVKSYPDPTLVENSRVKV